MKTFLKIVLFLVLGLVAVKLCPLLLAPALASVMVMLALGGVVLAGLATVAATGLTLTAVLLGVVLLVLAVLSPVWVPVLALIGLISLFRRRPTAA